MELQRIDCLCLSSCTRSDNTKLHSLPIYLAPNAMHASRPWYLWIVPVSAQTLKWTLWVSQKHNKKHPQGLSLLVTKLTNAWRTKQLLGHVCRSGFLMQYSKLSTPTLCLNIASSHAYSCRVHRITMLPNKIAYQTWTPWKLPWHKAQILQQKKLLLSANTPMMFVSSPQDCPMNITNWTWCSSWQLHTFIHEELSPSQDLLRYTVHMMRKHKAAGNHNSEQTQCLKGSAGEKRTERRGPRGERWWAMVEGVA